ncbi:hypothetical protein Tco_1173461 [Tanacetum coccineum]
MDNTGIFGNAYHDEDLEEEVDMNNVISSYSVLDTSFTKFHKDHPEDQVIGTMMETDRLLAERLQTREREELIDEEKGKLFMELMEKRRKHFAALRAQEKRNRPPTKMKRVNTFVAMSSEAQESNEKKVEGSEEKAKSSRKRVLVEKAHLVIKKDDDIAIDVIPLATKPLVIVDYKLLKEGIMVHYQLIRAYRSSKRHSSMIRLLQGIDKEDLQTLWNWWSRDLKRHVLNIHKEVMYEEILQEYKVNIWNLIDSRGDTL